MGTSSTPPPRCTPLPQRGRTPVVVGGTGFYLRWFIWGKPDTPPSTPASEAAASARLDQVGARAAEEGHAGGFMGWSLEPARGLAGTPASPLPPPHRSAALSPPAGQAYAEAEAAAAAEGRQLDPSERWAAACALVEALGDAASAERLRGEVNNQYRLLRVVDILLQTGGRPLAGARLAGPGRRGHDPCPCSGL